MVFGISCTVFSVFCIVMLRKYDCLCGIVVRVPGYRSRGPGSIPGTNNFSERGPLSFVSTIEELFERKSSGCGLENEIMT
jgi:hypothetical protein